MNTQNNKDSGFDFFSNDPDFTRNPDFNILHDDSDFNPFTSDNSSNNFDPYGENEPPQPDTDFSLFNASEVGRLEHRTSKKEIDEDDVVFAERIQKITRVNEFEKMRSYMYKYGLIVCLVIGLRCALNFLTSGGMINTATDTGYLYSYFLNAVICLGLPILMLVHMFRYEPSIPPRKGKATVPLGTIILSFLSLYFLAYIGTIVTDYFLPEEATSRAATTLPDGVMRIVIFTLFTVIIAPIAEEYIYRKVILERMRKFGDFAAVMITALLFSLSRGSVANLLYTFLAGIILGFLVIWTGSVLPSIIIHILYNVMKVATTQSLALAELDSFVVSLNALQVILYGFLLFGLISLVVLIVQGKFRLPNNCTDIKTRSKVSVTVLNPAIVAALAMAIVFSVIQLVQ